mgnify:CR=1 FL=1
MVMSMATKKITITLPEEQVELIRDLVSLGQANSISGFVQDAVNVALREIDGWGLELARALEATGGPLTHAEIEWANEILGIDPARTAAAL